MSRGPLKFGHYGVVQSAARSLLAVRRMKIGTMVQSQIVAAVESSKEDGAVKKATQEL